MIDFIILVESLRVHVYISKIPECNEPEKVYNESNNDDFPSFMGVMLTNDPVKDDLTVDVTDLVISNAFKFCGSNKIVYVLASSDGKQLYDSTSQSVRIDCQERGMGGDVKIELGNDIQGELLNIPNVQIGDRNPFGDETSVKISSASCLDLKPMACLYCGFDGNRVGVDNQTWYQWQTMEVMIPYASISLKYSYISMRYSFSIMFYLPQILI